MLELVLTKNAIDAEEHIAVQANSLSKPQGVHWLLGNVAMHPAYPAWRLGGL